MKENYKILQVETMHIIHNFKLSTRLISYISRLNGSSRSTVSIRTEIIITATGQR